MRISVEALDPKVKSLRGLIKKTANSVARFFNSDDRLKNGALEIILVGDKTLKKNVMSFPAPKNFPEPKSSSKKHSLGEIYLNPFYIERDLENMMYLPALQDEIKRENGLSLATALQYLLIHGFLHLLGYLHDKKSDRISMEKEEAKILSRAVHVQQ